MSKGNYIETKEHKNPLKLFTATIMKYSSRVFLGLVLGVVLIGCFSEPECNVSRRNEVFDTVRFDQNVIKNLSKYERLEGFLRKNADSILSYSTGECASVYKYSGEPWDGSKFSKIPRSILEELTKILAEIPISRITAFEICKDKSIRIIINSQDVDVARDSLEYITHVSAVHSLKRRGRDQFPIKDVTSKLPYDILDKDTLLNGQWIYRITVECDTR